ncbi:hypothetical protein D3C81_810800 [compost metagenome]
MRKINQGVCQLGGLVKQLLTEPACGVFLAKQLAPKGLRQIENAKVRIERQRYSFDR